MGFLGRLFGYKKKKKNQVSAESKERRRWSLARSSNTAPSQLPNKRAAESSPYDGALDANKHAIAVAAATAAVAEAALAAAHAAAEVVRLTSSSSGGRAASSAGHLIRSHWRRNEEVAAVKIQSAFRGYLARRALRALKALVKLQALVRGHMVRKQTADMLRRMQTLVKVQARARACRAYISESLYVSNSSRSALKVPDSRDNDDNRLHPCSTKFDGSSMLKRCGSNSVYRDLSNCEKARLDANGLEHWMEESLWNEHRETQLRNQHAYDEKCDKILEVDTWKPHLKSQQSNRIFHTSHSSSSNYTSQNFTTVNSPSKLSMKAQNRVTSSQSGEALSLSSQKFPTGNEEVAVKTAENSPHMFSASSKPGSSSSARRCPFTPTKSECSWGFFNGYSSYPNYMANTESSRAKVRSLSAPRQRIEFEKHGSTRRSLQGLWATSIDSERVFSQHTDCRNRAYPTSGRLNRIGSSSLR